MTEYYFDTNVIMGRPHRGDPRDFFALWNVAAEVAVFTCPDIGGRMGRHGNLARNARGRLRRVDENRLQWEGQRVLLRPFRIQAARLLLSIVSDANLLFARLRDDPVAKAENAADQGDYREVWRYEATENDRLGINDLMIVAAAAADGCLHNGPSGLLSNDEGMTALAERIGLKVIDDLNQAADLQLDDLNITPAQGFVAQCRSMKWLVDQSNEDGRKALFVTGQAVKRMIQDGGQFVLPAEATALLTTGAPARFVISLGTAVSWQLASHQRYMYAQGIGRRTMRAAPVSDDAHRRGLGFANEAQEAGALLQPLLNTGTLAVHCRTANGNRYEGIGVDVAVVSPNEEAMQTLTRERFTSRDTSILQVVQRDERWLLAPNVEDHTDRVIAGTLGLPVTVLTTENDAGAYEDAGLEVIAV